MTKVEGSRGGGEPKLRWMDGVKAAVERRGPNIKYASRIRRWRRAVHSKHMWNALMPLILGLVVWRTTPLMTGSYLGIPSPIVVGLLPGSP
jgi:hypothetical protein